VPSPLENLFLSAALESPQLSRQDMLAPPMRTPGSVLIVDDEAKIRELLRRALAEEGHDVVALDSAAAARAMLGTRFFDVLLVDNLMPDGTGLDLIRSLIETAPESERPQILMMTAHATVESATKSSTTTGSSAAVA
jgi:two-component system nitrogen regulation response regulator GlnG